MGYDIGCAFSKTLSNAKQSYTGEFTIPAMHGYCHNRLCQLSFQTIYKPGTGLSDFEQCEQFFLASNLMAALTRHATAFHRHQFIEMHMEQNDREKQENLGKFIFNNYRQALEIIREHQPLLRAAAHGNPSLTATTYENWLAEEHQYLLDLKKEPREDTAACLYVDALHQLWDSWYVFSSSY